MTESTVSIYFIVVLKNGETISPADFSDKSKVINYLTQDHFNNIFSESIEKKGRMEFMEEARALEVAQFFEKEAQYISVDKHYQVVKEEAKYTKLDMPHVEAHPHHDVAIDDDSHEVEIG